MRAIPVTTGLADIDNVLLLSDAGMCFVGWCEHPDGVEPLPGAHPLADIVGRIAVAELDTNAAFRFEEVAIAVPGQATIWIYEVVNGTEPAHRMELRQVITLPGPARSQPRFVDTNADDRLDLMVLVEVDSVEHVAISTQGLFGTFADATIADMFDSFAPTCGSSRWPRAVGHINPEAAGGEALDYVGDEAICLWVPIIGFLPVAVPTLGRPFREAVMADFNGDGNLDVAASFANVDNVDAFLNNGTGLFNPANVTVNHAASSLRVGDFDGDFIDDLAVPALPGS